MANKHTYIVNRSMHGDGRDYARGDKRRLTEADAAALVASGALSLPGEDPLEPTSAVRHTFGAAQSLTNDRGYTDAGSASLSLERAEQQTASMPAVGDLERLQSAHAEELRAPATFDMKLALGRADLIPEARAKVTGFKDVIDGTTWLVSEVSHRLDKGGGFTTSAKLECAP